MTTVEKSRVKIPNSLEVFEAPNEKFDTMCSTTGVTYFRCCVLYLKGAKFHEMSLTGVSNIHLRNILTETPSLT